MIKNKYPVVLVIHEDGNMEFCKVDYTTARIYDSVGFNAVGGDVEKARTRLYGSIIVPKKPSQ